ncbi:MAG: aminoacyl-tRNA hydrolase [Chloroflexi bacterium RBG_13_50_21]|nr:MAG: aminoacyl-tRNA hydrolase [Chloroflexi bacterium RBG_13_50_21]
MILPSQNVENQPKERHGPFIIAGLGNPGRKFEHNRHNIGFMLLNRLSNKLKESFGKVEAKALVCKANYQGERIILVKPQTYMNNSGMSVSSLVRFYQVSLENLLVTYDDVDLPFGVLRLRPSGGSGGQNGMQSIIERLGTEDFPRMRIGTGRPPGRMDAADYVLQDFTAQETELLNDILDRGVEAVLTFISSGMDMAMNAFNG